jgi:hypothetical protein
MGWLKMSVSAASARAIVLIEICSVIFREGLPFERSQLFEEGPRGLRCFGAGPPNRRLPVKNIRRLAHLSSTTYSMTQKCN